MLLARYCLPLLVLLQIWNLYKWLTDIKVDFTAECALGSKNATNKSMRSRRTHQLPLWHVIIADVCTLISPSQLIAQKLMCPIVGSTQKAIATYLIGQLHGLDQWSAQMLHLAYEMTGSCFSRPMGGNLLWKSAEIRTGRISKTWKVVTDCRIAKNSSLSKMILSNKPCTNSKALIQIFCASTMLRIRIVFPHCIHSLCVADAK